MILAAAHANPTTDLLSVLIAIVATGYLLRRALHRPRRCPACQGTGIRRTPLDIRWCDRCDGTG